MNDYKHLRDEPKQNPHWSDFYVFVLIFWGVCQAVAITPSVTR